MFKRTRFFLLAVCVLLSALFIFPTTAAASQISRNLQGGSAFTFSNSDLRSAMFVNISGGDSYEYVMRDADGLIVSYGTGFSRFQVLSGGETTILSAVNRTVTFSDVHITMVETEAPILQRVQLQAYQSVVIENTHPSENRRLMLDRAAQTGLPRYDIVVRDRQGRTTHIAETLIVADILIPASGSVTLLAVDALTLMFPAAWADVQISAPRTGPILMERTIEPGETLTISNNHATLPFTFRNTSYAQGMTEIDYTLSRNDREDKVFRTDITFWEMDLQPGQTWTFTVQSGPPLIFQFPTDWLAAGIHIHGIESPAVQSQDILPGQTLILRNTDLTAAFNLSIESALPGGFVQYNYVWESMGHVHYGIESGERYRRLMPGDVFSLTATAPEALRLSLPTVWEALETELSDTPAVFIQELLPGYSLRIDNENEIESLRITWRSVVDGAIGIMDYAAYDDVGEVYAFGVTAISGSRYITNGEALAFTHTEAVPLLVFFPYEWQGVYLNLHTYERPVLTRQVILPGAALLVQSVDRIYDRHLRIESAANPTEAPAEYGFITRDVAARRVRAISDFGQSDRDFVPLPAGGQITLSPARGIALTVVVPTEWLGSILTYNTEVEPPLYRVTLRPNRRLALFNQMEMYVTLQISGRYFLRWDDDTSAVTAREIPEEGDLTLGQWGEVSVIAAPGADVEIIMPMEWRDRIIVR